MDEVKEHGDEEAAAGDENKERGNWSNKFEGLLSLIGFNIGLENVWRFPYICYRNGGAVFLIPYAITLVLVAVPLTFLELSIGQFSSSGVLSCWNMAPIFRGIGLSMMLTIGMIAIYYNMVIGYAIFYIFSSFTNDVPWSHCDRNWNTQDCESLLSEVNCTGMTSYNNGTCYNGATYVGVSNLTTFTAATGRSPVPASQEYFFNFVLNIGESGGVDDIGGPMWQNALCLLGSWTIVYLCLIKGIKSTGKVVYFTVFFPYIFLIAMLIYALLQDGANDGIDFYIRRADWELLKTPGIWKEAAGQIFFSTSIGAGGLLTLSSYNRFHNNCFRDAILAPIGNCLTSFLAGFVVFANLGILAKQLGTTVEGVTTDGPGLVFVVYPNAFSQLPVTQLWSVLFFGMVITLGLDSVFGGIEMIVTGITDQFKSLRPYKWLVLLIFCICSFLIGLSVTTPGGLYVIQLLDLNVPTWGLMLNAFFTCIAVAWVYGPLSGTNRFLKDVRVMLGWPTSKAGWYIWLGVWTLLWRIISPGAIIFIFVFYIIGYQPLSLDAYIYPDWAQGVGWTVAMLPLACIPIVAIIAFIRESGGPCDRFLALVRPTAEWGPALPKHRRLVTHVKDFMVEPTSPAVIAATDNMYEGNTGITLQKLETH